MMAMILGVGVYGYVIGHVAHLLANLDGAKSHYRNTMERLTIFMAYRNVPQALPKRIYDYYNYLWEHRLGGEENRVLAELPPSLRTELSLALKHEFVEKIPFLQGASHTLIRDLTLEMQHVIHFPGDVLFYAGTIKRVSPNRLTHLMQPNHLDTGRSRRNDRPPESRCRGCG